MKKPVAYYTSTLFPPFVGTSARVVDVHHPVLGHEEVVVTSEIVKVFEEGFETRNTVYLKSKQAY